MKAQDVPAGKVFTPTNTEDQFIRLDNPPANLYGDGERIVVVNQLTWTTKTIWADTECRIIGKTVLLRELHLEEEPDPGWEMIEHTEEYYYWRRTDGKGTPIYNCTKENVPPTTDSGYFRLDSLKAQKNDKG